MALSPAIRSKGVPARTADRKRGAWLTLVASGSLIGLLVACDSAPRDRYASTSRNPSCTTRPIRMAVAASLRDVAEVLIDEFEEEHAAMPEIIASYGASNALARQIELGAPIDLLISADEEIVRALAAKSLIDAGSVVEIARGQIVLATRKNSPLESMGSTALRADSLQRFGLPNVAVPLGRYGRAWLEDQGLLERLEGKIVATENARANRAALDQGHVDVAILYASDMHSDLSVLLRPLDGSYPVIRYVAARVGTASDCPDANAGMDRSIDAALAIWKRPSSVERLREAGFGVGSRDPHSAPTNFSPSVAG